MLIYKNCNRNYKKNIEMWVFGGEKQNEIRRSDNNFQKESEVRKRKKVFKESEGEYVDFEEVN